MGDGRGRLVALAAVVVAGTLQWGMSPSIASAKSTPATASALSCQIEAGVYRTPRSGGNAAECRQPAAAASRPIVRASLVAVLSGAHTTGAASLNVTVGSLCYWLTWPHAATPASGVIVEAASGATVVTLFTDRRDGPGVQGCLIDVAPAVSDALATRPMDFAVRVEASSGSFTGQLHNRLVTFSAQVSLPASIVTGPDGNLWYTDNAAPQVARMTPAGRVTVYPVPLAGVATSGITIGPDGAVWFTVTDFGYSGGPSTPTAIGRLTMSGTMRLYPLPTGSSPFGLVFGPDGAIWYTDPNSNSIGRLTLDGRVVRFPIPTSGSNPLGITVGADGNLWFTENVTGGIGRLNPTTGVITEFPAPNPTDGITTGPDGNIWFADFSNVIFRITPVGVETAFPLGTGGIDSLPDDVVFDADGRLLFTEDSTNARTPEYVGRLDIHDGQITRFLLPPGSALPQGMTIAGSEHDIWFTEYDAGKIGRMLATPTALR
jgi:virginiamycin B lyase